MGNTIEKAAASNETFAHYTNSGADFLAAFGQAGAAAFTDSPLDLKTSEMLIVAIAIARQCETCLLLHTKKALEAGVTKAEMVAVANLSVVMGGGPASAYGAIALEMYDDYAEALKSADIKYA